jgi:short-subunit dehydrogenase
VLVNNAGIDLTKAFADASADELTAIYQVNLLAPAELCRQIVPRMLRRGRGHIVNVSSMAGTAVFPGLVAYSSTKAGLSHLTAGLRADLRKLPVGTTLVELGPIPTDMLDHVNDYAPTSKSFRRFYRMQLLTDIPRATVAEQVVAAVEHNRRHVRLPRRAILFPTLTEAPRRMVELLLTGVKHQA